MQPLVSPERELRGRRVRNPEDADVDKVLPVFVPSSFVATGAWAGPYSNLPARDVALVWAVLLPDHSIRYVLHETQREWEARGVDWRGRSLENLRARSTEPLGTGALFRDNGETWLISLTYNDGLGPSRLLLTDKLARVFPKGYRVALPERNRGFAFARDLDREDADTVENLIQRSYSRSDRPLSAGIFEPEDVVSAIRDQ